jgi:hypothetical protein
LLEALRSRGISLRVEGEQVLVSPKDQLTEADREAMRRHRNTIMITLRPPPHNGNNGNNGITAGEVDPEPRPVPPPGARLYFGDAAGRPCAAEHANHWTWEGGPTWFKVADRPIPFGDLAAAGQHRTWEGLTTLFRIRTRNR